MNTAAAIATIAILTKPAMTIAINTSYFVERKRVDIFSPYVFLNNAECK